MSSYDLVIRAKKALNIEADNQLANILGVSRNHVSNWKLGRNNPDGITMLRLADLAGMNTHDALLLVTRPAANDDAPNNQISDMVYIMLNSILEKSYLGVRIIKQFLNFTRTSFPIIR